MVAATQVFQFAVTIPAGTDITAPVTQDISFPEASVVGIRWRVPPGPSGFMGFAITSDGAAVIPVQPGAYIVADDEWDNLDLAGYQDSGAWQVTGYNNDGFDHTVYLIFKTVPPGGDQAAPASVQPAPALIDNAALSSSAPDVAGFLAGIQVQS